MVKQDKKAKNVQWTNVYVDALVRQLSYMSVLVVLLKDTDSRRLCCRNWAL